MPITIIRASSGATGVSAVTPFDWTRDKLMYQQWQTWSEWARHAAVAMEGDSEASKVHSFYNWIGKGSSVIENWKRKGTLIPQADYAKLEPDQRKDKYSSEKLESYFIIFEQMLAPRSNPLLAVKDLHCLRQNSMTAGEFYSQAHKIVQRCNFPNKEAEERAVRDALYLGMRSQKVKDKCINFINDSEELTIDFIMKHLEVEDSNSHHKSLSQMDSTMGVNFMSYDHGKGKGKDIRNMVPKEMLQHIDHKMDLDPKFHRQWRKVWKMWKIQTPSWTKVNHTVVIASVAASLT